MTLNGHIISTRGKRLHSIEIPMTGTGLTRPVIHAAEQAAKTWARELASLLRELGKEPSAELMSIVNRTGA